MTNPERICLNCKYWLNSSTSKTLDSPSGHPCQKIGPDLIPPSIPEGSAAILDIHFTAALVTRGSFGCSLFKLRI